MEVRTDGPAPPMSKPSSLTSSKAFWMFSVVQPCSMMSLLCPCSAIRPEPCFSQMSQNLQDGGVVVHPRCRHDAQRVKLGGHGKLVGDFGKARNRAATVTDDAGRAAFPVALAGFIG